MYVFMYIILIFVYLFDFNTDLFTVYLIDNKNDEVILNWNICIVVIVSMYSWLFLFLLMKCLS